MDENMMFEETTNTTEVSAPVYNETVTEKSSGSSMLTKAVIVGVIGAIGTGAAFGLNKLRKHNEKKTIERLKKEGWKIEEPEKPEEEVVEGEAVFEEEGSDK